MLCRQSRQPPGQRVPRATRARPASVLAQFKPKEEGRWPLLWLVAGWLLAAGWSLAVWRKYGRSAPHVTRSAATGGWAAVMSTVPPRDARPPQVRTCTCSYVYTCAYMPWLYYT